MIIRLLRITVIAAALAFLFAVSQRLSEARGNPPVPGTAWAIAVLSGLFLVRAVVTERSRGPEANLQKDLLWGLGAGGVVALLARL